MVPPAGVHDLCQWFGHTALSAPLHQDRCGTPECYGQYYLQARPGALAGRQTGTHVGRNQQFGGRRRPEILRGHTGGTLDLGSAIVGRNRHVVSFNGHGTRAVDHIQSQVREITNEEANKEASSDGDSGKEKEKRDASATKASEMENKQAYKYELYWYAKAIYLLAYEVHIY